MFNTPAGAARAVGLPAELTRSDDITANSQTIALGAVDNARTTIIEVACRADSAPTLSGTLGGFAMTHRITQGTSGGQNPSALFTIFTGLGSDLAAATTAQVVISGVTIQRMSGLCFRALNLADEAPAHILGTTAQNGSMSLNQFEDGISIAGGYQGDTGTYVWAGLDNSRTVEDAIGATWCPGGWELTPVTQAQALTVSPVQGTQYNFISASWQGASNP